MTTMLKQQLRNDLITAMKSRDEAKLLILRSLMAELRNKEIDIQEELDDDKIISLIAKQIKLIGKAKEMFAKGNRKDLVQKSEAEIKILSSYLPKK
jgi:uncharacterized protein